MINEKYGCSSESECGIKINKIKAKLDILLQHRDMKLFLNNKKNKKLFSEILNEPSEKKLVEFQKIFQNYYRNIWIMNFLVGMIKRYAIDFDKRIRKHSKRNLLIIDKSANAESQTVYQLNQLHETPENIEYLSLEKELIFKNLDDEKTKKILSQISDKELNIINLYYVQGYTNKEIGKIYNQTEQNIWYLHRKSLKKIKKILIEEQ